ncbi:MAG TPA: hypothetical protein PKN32_09985 [Bacteroidales bacterium]|nr:hypothetical protein [Bacteroidales bacterium]
MKKIVLIFVFAAVSTISFAQLTVGGHFAYNSTWLMNKQVFDEGAEMDVAASFGNYFGLIAGYYFSDEFGLEINFNSNKIEQKYSGSIKYVLSDERNNYNASTVLKTTDIPILMKFGKNSYFEFGPLFQLINKATYTRTFDATSNFGWYNDKVYPFTNELNKGVKAEFNGMGVGVCMGFGANFNLIEDVLKLNFGLRFNYILTDIQGVNGLGLVKEDPSYISDSERVNFKTNPLYGGLKMGLVYIFE